MSPTLIHRHARKSGKPAGTVERDGRVLGRAFIHARVAAGTGGIRRRFWTATPAYPGVELGSGPSLGTRHPSRASAVRAIRAFHAAYPGIHLANSSRTFAYVARFKREDKEICALP